MTYSITKEVIEMQSRSRKILVGAIAAILSMTIILPLFAAGQGEEATGEITIEMWTHDALYTQFFQKRVDKLNAENPDRTIILEAQEMPEPITSFISAYVAREELPDLIGVEQGFFPILMEDDIVEDVLVDLTDRIGDRYDEFVEGRWALYTHNDRIYGVESALSAAVHYYQPAIFEEHGVEIPTTWEEYVAAGRELAEAGVSIGIMDNDSSGLFSMMFLQRGGQFFDQDANLVFGEGENREHAIAVLETLRELIDSGALLDVLGNEFWGSTIPTAFSEGRVAGIVAPDWYNTSVLQPGVEDMAGEWRVAPMPVWSDVSDSYATSVWGGTGFAVTQASEHPEVVWELINDAYMTLDGQLDRYETIGFYPTMYEALDHPQVSDQEHSFFGGQNIGQVLADVALETPPLWQSPARPFLLEALINNLSRFIDGQISPEEFVDSVVTSTEADAEL
jgi:ABC-type glycerol-3-phosphate transport system substrate-binding protein